MTAKPYTAAELAGLREVAAVVKASDTSLTARLLATVAAVEGERDELREAGRALLADRLVTLCSRCEGRGEVEFEVLPDGRRPASRHCTLCDGTGERVLVRRLRALVEAKP